MDIEDVRNLRRKVVQMPDGRDGCGWRGAGGGDCRMAVVGRGTGAVTSDKECQADCIRTLGSR